MERLWVHRTKNVLLNLAVVLSILLAFATLLNVVFVLGEKALLQALKAAIQQRFGTSSEEHNTLVALFSYGLLLNALSVLGWLGLGFTLARYVTKRRRLRELHAASRSIS